MALIFALLLFIVASDAQLVTRSGVVISEEGGQVTITCRAIMHLGDRLMFSKGSKLLKLSHASALDPVSHIPFSPVTNPNHNLTVANVHLTTDSVEIEHRYKLMFIQHADEDSWICTLITANDTETTANITLDVVGPPYDIKLTSISGNVKLEKQRISNIADVHAAYIAYVNTDVQTGHSIKCEALSSPSSTVNWVVDSIPGSSDTLDLDVDEQLQGTTFTCVARNEYGDYNASITVETQYKPRLSSAPPDIDLIPGSEQRASCEFDAKPTATVWFVKMDVGEWERLDSVEPGTLIIRNVNLARDVGKYKCTGENEFGTASGEFEMFGKPTSVVLEIISQYGNSADLALKARSFIPVEFELHLNNSDEENANMSYRYSIPKSKEQNPPDINIPHLVNGLKPHTEYTVTLLAINDHGSTVSRSAILTTKGADITRPSVPTTAWPKQVKSNEQGSSSAALCPSFVMLMTALLMR